LIVSRKFLQITYARIEKIMFFVYMPQSPML